MSDSIAENGKKGLTDGQKEQIKLAATYLNGIAVGLFVFGSASIPTSIVLTSAQPVSKGIAITLGLFSIALSPYLHLTARRSLLKLDR